MVELRFDYGTFKDLGCKILIIKYLNKFIYF